MTTYEFTLKFETKNFEIGIDPASLYGYFEHHSLGDNCGGGLWFEMLEGNVLNLIDYDGVYSLPLGVVEGLTKNGVIVEPDMY